MDPETGGQTPELSPTTKGAVIINNGEGVEAFWKYVQTILDPSILAMKKFRPHLIFAKKFQTPDSTIFYWISNKTTLTPTHRT